MCRPKPPANPPPSPQYTAPVPPSSIPPPNYFLTPWSETVAYKRIWFARGDYLPVSTTTGIIRGISFVSPTRVVGNRIKGLSCMAIIFLQKKEYLLQLPSGCHWVSNTVAKLTQNGYVVSENTNFLFLTQNRGKIFRLLSRSWLILYFLLLIFWGNFWMKQYGGENCCPQEL